MPCSGAYATAEQYAMLFCLDLPLTGDQETVINNLLELSAGMLHAARMATGGCDCTLSSGADSYLAYLNSMLAATYYNCPCGRTNLTEDDRNRLAFVIQEQLNLIRTGVVELCEGETGTTFPVIDWAEQTLTEWNVDRIIFSYMLRTS